MKQHYIIKGDCSDVLQLNKIEGFLFNFLFWENVSVWKTTEMNLRNVLYQKYRKK